MKTRSILSMAGATVLLAACNANSPSAGGDGSLSPLAKDRYALAGGCYAMQSVRTGDYVASVDGGYKAAAADPISGEAFFMQAATLGKYLFYATDRSAMSASGEAVQASQALSNDAIWTIDYDAGSDHFSVASESAGQSLIAAEDGTLTLGSSDSDNAAFRFVPTREPCSEYPEMPTAVSGETFKGRGVDQPAIGFADVHTHMGMSSEMSYAGDVGPSAGGVLYGEVFHRFGVPHALEDCADFHGPQGIRDANNILEGTPVATHDTQGWPTFVGWPQRNFLTHQVMYYKWVERAWLSGLRLIVNHGTNIAALCEVGKLYSLTPTADCNDASVSTKQVEYLYEVQDYVDAQNGGPGKGWFRIVKSPLEAREVINDGKLAVVLGIEVAQVFNCGVTMLPGDIEIRQCDEQQISEEIDRLWELGVRHIYPYHDIDSSLGGAGIFSGDVINFLNFLDTGRFWETTECREHPEDEPAVRYPGTEMTTAIPGTGNDPLTALLLEVTGGTLPTYPPGKRCNARTVTDLGEYALNAIMDKRMVIDIDHAAYHSKDIMLNIAEQRDPPYPMASSHDAHGGLTSDQAIRMLKAGGTIYPYKGNGIKHVEFLEKLKFWRERAGVENEQLLGLGYGADANGFGGHPGPRGGDAVPVEYPFTLFSGDDWGGLFSGFAPLTVDLLSIPESGKFWHIDEVGMAHYGLVADFVEEVRLEGGNEALEALFNSAEAYIQMWERVYNRD